MKTKDVYEALGLKMPGENPGAASPAGDDVSEGENVQTVAGSAEHETEGRELPLAEAQEPSSGGGKPTSKQEEGNETGTPSTETAEAQAPMSKEERARQARLRREREQKAAIDRALAEQQQAQDEAVQKAVSAALAEERGKQKSELDAFFSKAQLTNTLTGKPITSMEEFNDWEQAYGARRLEQSLKAGKLGVDELNRAIEQNPVIRQIQQQAQQAEQARKAQQKQDFDTVMARELDEIRKMDPSIKSIEDVLSLPTGQEFSRLVQQHHLTFPQAFRLANDARISGVQQQAAQEAAARSLHSKDHLRGFGISTNAGQTMTAKTKALYRALMPELTDAQILEDFAKRS